MSADEILNKHQEQSQAALESFRRDLQKVRTGRASSGLVEGLNVDYYGAKTQLGHLAQISTPEAKLIVVQVYDAQAVEAVEKAIQGSGLGLNPSREGNTLLIRVPALTEDSRKDIIRHLHKLAEDIRVSVRNHRREANDTVKKLEKGGDLTKDDARRVMDKVQEQTDSFVAEVDQLLKAKEAECMEV